MIRIYVDDGGGEREVTTLVAFVGFGVKLNANSNIDTADLRLVQYGDRDWTPAFGQPIRITDGSTALLAGEVQNVRQDVDEAGTLLWTVQAADYKATMDRIMVSGSYEDATIAEVVADITDQVNDALTETFDASGVTSTFAIERMVFNRVPFSTAMNRIAQLAQLKWDVDSDKNVSMYAGTAQPAPFALEETGSHVWRSLQVEWDANPLANLVTVRGGLYDAETFQDVLTVKGNASVSFKLPYPFANLAIELDTGGGYVSKTVGAKNLDSFDDYDVLYDYNADAIEFPSALADGNKIRFTGNPKVNVMAIAEDLTSKAAYRLREKVIRDPSIRSNTVARQRAFAELDAYKNPVAKVTFETDTPGLLPGQLLTVDIPSRGLDLQVVIETVQVQLRTPTSGTYKVTGSSATVYTLEQVLRSLLEPKAADTDETEKGERLYAAADGVSITDEAVAGQLDPDDITWVYWPHTPDPWQTDTTRAARYGGGAWYN